jgi:hypothetical protein
MSRGLKLQDCKALAVLETQLTETMMGMQKKRGRLSLNLLLNLGSKVSVSAPTKNMRICQCLH